MARPRTSDALARERAFNLVRRFIKTAGETGERGEARWRRKAACAGAQPDIFYPRTHEDTGPIPVTQADTIRLAKLICWGDDTTTGGCPVRMECLAYAMGRHERHGIWGGLTFNERQALRRAGYEADERRKARRRAVAAARRPARSVTITTDRGANQTWQ